MGPKSVSSRRAARLAHHQLRLHRNFCGDIPLALNALNQSFSSDFTHSSEGLSHGGQTGRVVSGGVNIVKTDYRYILRDAKALFLQGANRANRSEIVVSK